MTQKGKTQSYVKGEAGRGREGSYTKYIILGLKQRRGDISVASHVAKVTVLDVRHCSTKTPSRTHEIGATIIEGEKEKDVFYQKHFRFPEGVVMVPVVVDSYGKWGERAKTWLEDLCKKAARGDMKLYSRQVHSVERNHSGGSRWWHWESDSQKCVEKCFCADSYLNASARGGGAFAA